MKQWIVALPLLVMGTGVAKADAELETIEAVGACQAALPVHDGELRKRPLAIANEGTSTAFVSCSVHSHLGLSYPAGVSEMYVSFRNRSSVNTEVACTFVGGDHFAANNTYFPKTVSVMAGSGSYVNWQHTNDNSGLVLDGARFSCALPPGVEIGSIQVTHGT